MIIVFIGSSTLRVAQVLGHSGFGTRGVRSALHQKICYCCYWELLRRELRCRDKLGAAPGKLLSRADEVSANAPGWSVYFQVDPSQAEVETSCGFHSRSECGFPPGLSEAKVYTNTQPV